MIAGLGSRLIAVLAGAALLVGCTRNETLGLHGAAMMRVEVEVYKGPLSVAPSAQMGELVAVISDAIRANADWREGAALLEARLQCGVAGEGGGALAMAGECAALKSAMDSAEDAIGAGCYVLDTPAMHDLVGLATYLPHGTCGRYADAWRHIELKRGDYQESMQRALDEVQRTMLVDALAALEGPVKDEADAIAALKTTPEDPKTQKAVKDAKSVIDGKLTALSGALLASVRGSPPASNEPLPLPTLYDVFARASLCGVTIDAADERARRIALVSGKDGEPRLPRPLTNNLRCEHEAVVLAVQNMASMLRAAGFRSSFGNVRFVSRNQQVRAQLTAFSFLEGEYGNQIQSRIAVLAKQLAEGREPSNLPLSDYLRDVSNTDAVNLFDWLKASEDQPGRSRPGGFDAADRVRMVERLTSDYYWRKINDVYTSGQGDVTSVFVKDDIGNWSLKRFGNEPGKLLKAYRGAANAAIVSAAKLAAKAANPGAAAAGQTLERTSRLMSLARQFATGRMEGDGGGGQTAEALLAGLVTSIETRRAQFVAEEKRVKEAAVTAAYATKIPEQEAALLKAQDAETKTLNDYAQCAKESCATIGDLRAAQARASDSRFAAQKALDDLKSAKAKNEADLAALPAKATAAIQGLIDDERIAIDALQKAALPASDPAPQPDAIKAMEAIKAAAAGTTS